MHDPLSPAAFESFVLIESNEKGKDQESIQSSTTPDPGHHMGM